VNRCTVFGHRYRFTSDGPTMTWTCACGSGGSKTYRSARDATRYAAVFDREDSADLGRRAPLLGMFPLRIAYAIAHRKGRSQRARTEQQP
jgi:hypothetical protein